MHVYGILNGYLVLGKQVLNGYLVLGKQVLNSAI